MVDEMMLQRHRARRAKALDAVWRASLGVPRKHVAEVLRVLDANPEFGPQSTVVAVLTDLQERLVKADAELVGSASPEKAGRHYDERVRLLAKAAGVRLALSYVDETLREAGRG